MISQSPGSAIANEKEKILAVLLVASAIFEINNICLGGGAQTGLFDHVTRPYIGAQIP
jgi:hypothetical protein